MAQLISVIVLGLTAASTMVPVNGGLQPDLSGEWVLVEALIAGPTRGPGGTPGTVLGELTPTNKSTLGGVAFNCGGGCTIRHSESTIRITDAKLMFHDRDEPRPAAAVTIQVNGHQSSIPDPISPSEKVMVTAKWIGSSLQVVNRLDPVSVTQVLTLDGDRLVVASSTMLFKESRARYKFTYKRK